MKKEEIVKAHEFSFCNKEMLLKDKVSGCFYCLKIFNPNEINEWVDEGKTAICPYCGIDSVIGESSKVQITEDFLKAMKNYWF